jgi:outer membrane protein assembly factor BamD (BamD/ComL family)
MAVEELNKLIELYRNSLFAEEGRALLQDCYERLAESEFLIGRFYLDTRKWCRGAIPRLKGVLEAYPTYSGADKVYFHLGSAYELCNSPSEALPYYQRVIDNYPDSEHRNDAEERLTKLLEAAGNEKKAKSAAKTPLK